MCFSNYPRNCFRSASPLTPQILKRCNTLHVRISKTVINANETVSPQIHLQVNNYGRHGWNSAILQLPGLKPLILWTGTRLASYFLSFIYIYIYTYFSKTSLTCSKEMWWKKAFAHVKYIFINEYAHVLRLLLKLYQGDGPWWQGYAVLWKSAQILTSYKVWNFQLVPAYILRDWRLNFPEADCSDAYSENYR